MYGQKTTETGRHNFILFIKLIRYVSFSSEDFRAFSEYLEGPEDSSLVNYIPLPRPNSPL